MAITNMTATEVQIRQEQFNKQAAKTISSTFVPELWSKAMLDVYKKNIFNTLLPKRSKGTQLLRDAALGHQEYPDDWRGAIFEENAIGGHDNIELTSFTITVAGT